MISFTQMDGFPMIFPYFTMIFQDLPKIDGNENVEPLTIVISAINHSEMGVMFTNLAIPNWGTTLHGF